MDKKYLWVINKFNGQTVYNIDFVPTIIESLKGNIAKGFILNNDFTLTPTFVARVDDCFAHGKDIHSAVEEATNKSFLLSPIESRISKFVEKYPTLDTKATGKEFYTWHNRLTGSCTQGRDQFCKNHDVNLNEMYTVEYFIDLVKNDYGSSTILELSKRY